MSKKINISIPNKVRPNLINLFHTYLSRKVKEPNIREAYIWDEDEYDDIVEYWDKMFPGWDSDGEALFPPKANVIMMNSGNRKGKHKEKHDEYASFWEFAEDSDRKKGKHKHNKGKRARLHDIRVPYNGEEDEYNFDDINLSTDDYEPETKEIWFYPDYHCKEDRLEFNSIKEFNDYCDSMGYYVEKDVLDKLTWYYESHCCLNPESEKIGLLEIMSERSYGDMFYVACEENEL